MVGTTCVKTDRLESTPTRQLKLCPDVIKILTALEMPSTTINNEYMKKTYFSFKKSTQNENLRMENMLLFRWQKRTCVGWGPKRAGGGSARKGRLAGLCQVSGQGPSVVGHRHPGINPWFGKRFQAKKRLSFPILPSARLRWSPSRSPRGRSRWLTNRPRGAGRAMVWVAEGSPSQKSPFPERFGVR